MQGQLGVSLIGCGGMASHYLSIYRDLEWVRVVSCIDANEENATRAAATFRTSPLAATDFSAALESNVDVVVISTPNFLHAPQAIAAIAAGKHVLIQKPVAANLQDAEAIASVAAGSEKTIGLYMSYFDQPLIHDLRQMVYQGRLGSIVHCYARLMHKGGMMWSREILEGKPTWRGSTKATGGGCFIQLAVHHIHIFEWITGACLVRATAFTNNLHSSGIEGEDIASTLLQFDTGALLTIDTAWCADGEELAIFGTHGKVHYRSNRWLALASRTGPFEGRVISYSGGLVDAFGGAEGAEQRSEVVPPAFGDSNNPLNQHRAFLEAARDGLPAPVSVRSGIRDLRIVMAVYESARTGRAVDIQ